MLDKIVYPMTLDYVPDWQAWQVVRELVTNALDADPGFRMSQNKNDTLWIESKGYVVDKHLLFGVSEKNGPGAIGQFGEGLKLALLVLTRLGLTAHVYSGGTHYWNEPAQMTGEDVFAIRMDDSKESVSQGTRIEIPDWTYPTYEERFLRPGDPRILFADPFDRYILEEETPSLYVKGVWVQRANYGGRGYAFGYNLIDVEMNRDRGVVNFWNANTEIGKIWASVTDEELLERFWQSVKDTQSEANCKMYHVTVANRDGMRRAMRAVYGQHAVLETDPAMAREAQYRGAQPVSPTQIGGYGMRDVVADLIGTDTNYVAQMEGKSRTRLPDKKLGEIPLKNLRVLRRLARRLGFNGKIMAYILPPGEAAATNGDDIHISIGQLDDDEDAIASLIHEIAHTEYNTEDATAQHVEAVAKIAARLIATYTTRR